MTTTAALGIRTGRDSCVPIVPIVPTRCFGRSAGTMRDANATNWDANAAAVELLEFCHAQKIYLTAENGRLEIDAPAGELTDELLQRLRTCKAELLQLLASDSQDLPGGDPHGADGPQDLQPSDIDAGEWLDLTNPDGRRCLVRSDAAEIEIIDPMPCPVCGGIDRWQDVAGDWHCPTCRPISGTGERLRQRVAALRQRFPAVRPADLQPRPVVVPRTWPPVVPDSILADPIPTCSDCGRPRSVVPGQPGRPAGLCFSCWGKRR